MRHVPEHVATVKGNHGNQVGESKQEVDPNEPEKEVDEDQHAVNAEDAGHDAIALLKETLLHGMHRHPLELKGHEDEPQGVNRRCDKALGEACFDVGGEWAGKAVDADGAVGHLLHAEEGIARFDAVGVELCFSPAVLCVMFPLVAEPRFSGSRFPFEVDQCERDRFAGLQRGQRLGERRVVHDRHVVDGHDAVPRFEACFLCTGAHHDATDVHAFLGRSELAGEAAQKQQEDHGGEDVGRRSCCKHAQTFPSRRLQEFLGLRLGKGTEGQRAELEQAKGANAHAVAACEQSVTELVDDQGHDEGQGAPAERNHGIQSRDRHKFRGRWRVGGGALGDGQHEAEHHQQPGQQHGAHAHPSGHLAVGPPEFSRLGHFLQHAQPT